ncbi:MAG TPA: hypothetical protein DD400_04015 [Rhodospirillaceae bacterium]|nr:hypothetical protein [Rhodospirillaceae bacterium]
MNHKRFLMSIERLFTTGSLRPEDMVLPKEASIMEDGSNSDLQVPENWSLEAADSFRESLCKKVPVEISLVEENTVPSWLWARRAREKTAFKVETNANEVFSRIAGAATYRGWKAGLWGSEIEASIFYDEVKAILLTRRVVFSPKSMALMGLDWAYGQETIPDTQGTKSHFDTLVLQNETIDSILSHAEPTARNKWSRFCETSRNTESTSIAFADTLTQWNTLPCPTCAPRAQINLLAFRQMDGSLDLTGLQQTTRLAVLLMELHEDVWQWKKEPTRPLALSFGNLSSLLMSLALPYDSCAARTTAAALASIITGTATLTSAQLAEKKGSCPSFATQREAIIRSLRNRVRACFGEENDYEHLSVTPQTIRIDSGADLVLISAARHISELALDKVQKHGLRHLQTTSLFTDFSFSPLLDSSAQGTEAEASLTRDYAQDDSRFARCAHPAVSLGMKKLGYDAVDRAAIREHLTGARTLVAAPWVNRTYLKEKGFDDARLDRIEESLSQISHLKQAFTPWALGLDFCRNSLKVPANRLKDLRFDVLHHLGFLAREISAASTFCCGHRSTRGALELKEKEHEIFATREDLSPESQIRMGAAVQPFIDGETNLTLSIPAAVVAQVRGDLILMAWKMGLKNMSLRLDGLPVEKHEEHPVMQLMKRRTTSSRTKVPLRTTPKKKKPALSDVTAQKQEKARASISLKPRSRTGSEKRRG